MPPPSSISKPNERSGSPRWTLVESHFGLSLMPSLGWVDTCPYIPRNIWKPTHKGSPLQSPRMHFLNFWTSSLDRGPLLHRRGREWQTRPHSPGFTSDVAWGFCCFTVFCAFLSRDTWYRSLDLSSRRLIEATVHENTDRFVTTELHDSLWPMNCSTVPTTAMPMPSEKVTTVKQEIKSGKPILLTDQSLS